MKTIATYNIKGGVGKTATAVNLSFLAAAGGARVLLWDLDPQGAATYYFRVKPKVKGGARRLLRSRSAIEDGIRGTDFDRLDLLPADFRYRHMDIEIGATKKPLTRLSRVLEPVAEEYDYVFLDCAPSISLVSESVFRAADALVVPTIPTTLSLRTLAQLRAALQDVRAKRIDVLPFFCMVDRRKRLHRDVIATGGDAAYEPLATQIPYSSSVEKMGLARAPIHTFAHRSAPAKAYQALWEEVRKRV